MRRAAAHATFSAPDHLHFRENNMTTTLRTALAAAAAALVLAACQTVVPIYSVNDTVVSTTSGKHLTAGQVRSAIITAGTSLGWHVTDAGPGRLAGTLHLRTHSAVVDIPYSATKYSILYRSSEDLQA